MNVPGSTISQEPARGRTVLVADDDLAVRTFLAGLLCQPDVTVMMAGDGAEAMALARSSLNAIDLLVTDFEMPHLNGLQLAAGIRSIFPDVRVILISGMPDQAPASENVAAFFKKPFTAIALLEKAAALLGRNPTGL